MRFGLCRRLGGLVLSWLENTYSSLSSDSSCFAPVSEGLLARGIRLDLKSSHIDKTHDVGMAAIGVETG